MSSATQSSTPQTWWRNAVVYQIYIRSFADGDGDGTGDIAGIRSRLPYLRDLGVDAIWINPWYPSPLHDGGYDVADYRDIDPRYGTLDQAEELIAAVHDHGMRILVDLVPNHTSSAHQWFREAVAASPGDPARARYEIHPGTGPDGAAPPSDWQSVFGGPAWERLDDGEWYLHLFDVSQPDLNWDNPEVREEFKDIFSFWLDRGADGFRVDVAHSLVKDKTFPSAPARSDMLDPDAPADHPFWDRDGVHDIIRGWRGVLDTYDGDRMMVAEAWVRPERLRLYLRPNEYNQAFNFALTEAEWDAREWRSVIDQTLAATTGVGATPTWTLSNHDLMRPATRFGLPAPRAWRTWLVDGPATVLDAEAGRRRAVAASLAMLALPGSAYLYQGEELALPEVWDLPEEVLDDPIWEHTDHTEKGRDGCRVPIPWAEDGPSFGFGDGQPWLPQPAVFGQMSVQAQTDVAESALETYRRALALRRSHGSQDDVVEWLELGADVLAFRRSGGLMCVTNFGEAAVQVPEGEVLLSSLPVKDGLLPANASAWLR